MADYKSIVERLRLCESMSTCIGCPLRHDGCVGKMTEAADAIEELLKAAKKMHTWIFLHTGDEQKAYDECGLTDEMNMALGYGGSFELRSKADPCEKCVHYPPSSTDGKPCCACDPGNPLTNCKREDEA